MNAAPPAQQLLTSPGWHLHRIDPVQRRVLFIQLGAEQFRQASFLDERVESQASAGYWYDAETILDTFDGTPDQPPAMIFHGGHVGSTLLSRVLAGASGALALREPLSLRFLADTARQQDLPWAWLDGRRWRLWSDVIRRALGRPFERGQPVLVKATSHCGNLAAPWLRHYPDWRGLGLYLRLPRYLATCLKTDRPRADLRGFAQARVQDHLHLTGDALAADPSNQDISLARLSDDQLLGLSWLTTTAHLVNAADQAPQRLRLVDFEHWLQAPADSSADLLDHLHWSFESEVLSTRLARELQRYSKDPQQPYSPARRQQTLQATSTRHRDRIAAISDWVAGWTERAPVYAALKPYLR